MLLSPRAAVFVDWCSHSLYQCTPLFTLSHEKKKKKAIFSFEVIFLKGSYAAYNDIAPLRSPYFILQRVQQWHSHFQIKATHKFWFIPLGVLWIDASFAISSPHYMEHNQPVLCTVLIPCSCIRPVTHTCVNVLSVSPSHLCVFAWINLHSVCVGYLMEGGMLIGASHDLMGS